jgi:ubiquinone/menaquinone biosynthesis C-methylase UbiE
LSDFAPGMVKKARKNLRDSARSFAFQILDTQSIPYKTASFDAVIANHMLYHVPDRAKALAEIQRVLRPGGKLYTSTVGERHTQELFATISRFAPDGKFKHVVSTFTLENGAEQLAPWFTHIELRRYKDNLEITKVEPLVAYIMSMVDARSIFAGEKLSELVSYLERAIATQGAIHITKDSGMFQALRDK